jgi:hypothetical protein
MTSMSYHQSIIIKRLYNILNEIIYKFLYAKIKLYYSEEQEFERSVAFFSKITSTFLIEILRIVIA